MSMKRRDFVKNVSLASMAVPFTLKGMNFQASGKPLFTPSKSAEDRVLVIIRLSGGNDGLNTVIPLDFYDNLQIQRSNIIIPENQILNVNSTIGFHPAMTGMKNMFNDGKLAIVQNVGYPEQNRSHFRSMDIWNSGLIDQNATTGWVGRHLDSVYPNFPTDYPNQDNPDPFAISMGYQVAANCQGLYGNFSHTVEDPTGAYNVTQTTVSNDGTYFGAHMEYLTTIIAQTNAYGARIQSSANSGNSLSQLYDLNNPLAVQLKNVAKMISGGLKTKVYVLGVDGFDTHNAQVLDTDVTQGTHHDLLKRLSDAIYAFQDDLALLGLENRVAGMTYSEFGRQIASNASLGTDHGDAAPLFLFGSCLNAQVIGSNPVITNQIVDQLGIPMQIDFRNVYASILKDWFEVNDTDIQPLFEQNVTYYDLMNSCNLGIDEVVENTTSLMIFPNPASHQTTVKFRCLNEKVKISIYNLFGVKVMEMDAGILNSDINILPIDISSLSTGEYILSIEKASGNQAGKLLKIQHL